MGTNFYLFSKNKELVKKLFNEDEYMLVDEPDFGYEIHICKRSAGWKPLFQAHKQFSSFKQLEKFYKDNYKDFTIYDEYNESYDFNGFKKEIIFDNEPEPYKWVYGEDEFSDKKYLHLKNCDESEADIYTPFDHREYAISESNARKKFHLTTRWVIMEDNYNNYSRDLDYAIDWYWGGDFC